MLRPVFRAAIAARAIPAAQHTSKRFASTASSKSGTWKGAVARWGAAGAIVYYYNTSTVFAEEPQYAIQTAAESVATSESYRTVDSIAEQRRARARSTQQQPQTSPVNNDAPVQDHENVTSAGPEALEEEAEQQGAFNEETGEINWDCPCLGGMAYGPCGEQFRAAFSCFVFSKDEPKGVDCIEHFKTMQNCFREHPEIYGSEMDEEEVDTQLGEQEGNAAPLLDERSTAVESPARVSASAYSQGSLPNDQSAHTAAEGGVPKTWHDGKEDRSGN